MPGFIANCPSCSAALKISNPSLAGKKVKCPKCSTLFQLPQFEEPDVETLEEESDHPVRETAEERTPSKVKRRLEDDEDLKDEPKAPPKRKETASESIGSRSSTRRRVDDDDDRPRRRRDEDDEDDRPRRGSRTRDWDEDRPRKKKKSRSQGYGGNVVLFVVLGSFLLSGLGVGIYYLVRPSHNHKVVEINNFNDDDDEIPRGRRNQNPNRQQIPIREKNDIDSILAELSDVDRVMNDMAATAFLPIRIEQNIPVNTPRRAELFKAIRAVSKAFHDEIHKSSWLEAAVRYATSEEESELLEMLKEPTPMFSREKIVNKLVEIKSPKAPAILIEELKSEALNAHLNAENALRRMGSSVEKQVQSVAGSSSTNYHSRILAINLLGDIGTEDSAVFLLTIKDKELLTQAKWAVDKIRKRKNTKSGP